MRIDHAVEIARPPEEVFAFVADPENLTQWQSGLVEVRCTGEPGLGARHVEVRSFMGARVEQTLEVAVYEPPHRLDFRVVEGPMALRLAHVFERTGDGTRVRIEGEGDPGPLFRFADAFVALAAKRQSRADFAKLKRVLEQSSGPRP